jgi:hypothetical protein
MTAPSGRVYSAYDRAYDAQPAIRKKHYERTKARRMAIKRWGKAAIAGKDIDHIRSLQAGGGTDWQNLRPRAISSNRGDKTFYN